MGMISNMFKCVDGQREGVGALLESSWSFDFCHVEPAAPCMVDDLGKLVVDFVIRWELGAGGLGAWTCVCGAAGLAVVRYTVGGPEHGLLGLEKMPGLGWARLVLGSRAVRGSWAQWVVVGC
jgi:hypothetical protein